MTVLHICKNCKRARATVGRLCAHCVKLIQDKKDLDEMARMSNADLDAIRNAFHQHD